MSEELDKKLNILVSVAVCLNSLHLPQRRHESGDPNSQQAGGAGRKPCATPPASSPQGVMLANAYLR